MTRHVSAAFGLIVAAAFLPVHAQNQQPRPQPGWPCEGRVDPAYVLTAEATGGAVLLFQPTEISGAAAEMSASRQHEEMVFRAGGQLIEGTQDFDIPIDTTIESAYFFISLQCLHAVGLVRPSGEDLVPDSGEVEYQHFKAVRMFTIKKPDPGTWRVRVSGKGFFSLIVKAKTDLQLTGASFVEDGVPLTGPVKQGQPRRFETRMSGDANDIEFEFISVIGATIEPVKLDLESEFEGHRTYGGEVNPPSTDFRLAMTGTDRQGYRFQRIRTHLFMSR